MMELLRIYFQEYPERALRASTNKLRHARLQAFIRKAYRLWVIRVVLTHSGSLPVFPD
jgi:hypothetical protein